MRDLIIKRIGQEEFEALKIRANMVVNLDLRAWELQLIHELQDYVNLPDNWKEFSYAKKESWLREVRKTIQ